MTEAGSFFLTEGRYPDGHWRDPGRPPNPYREQRARPVTGVSPAEQLVADVQVADGRLEVDTINRHDVQSLIASANRFGKVPPGFLMRWEQGRSWSQGYVCLVPLPGWVPTAPIPVPVPAARRALHPVVEKIKANEHRLPWAKPIRARALRLLHALCLEADRRSYSTRAVDLRERASEGLLQVEVRGHSIALAMRQLDDRTPHVPTAKELQDQARYSWNKIPAYDYTPSGRLHIEICTGSLCQQDRFADTKRGQLEDRLGLVLFEIELRAAKAEEQRIAREAEATERRLRWQIAYDHAVERAREEYRWEVLAAQEHAWRWHQRMTRVLEALEAHAAGLDAEQRSSADEWVAWVRTALASREAFPRELGMPSDPEFTPDRLQPHMGGFPPRRPE